MNPSYNRDTQTETHRWMNSRQGRSGHTALYSILRWVRVPYLVLRLYVCPPIQEEGDGGSMTIASSLMEGGISILQQGRTDRHTNKIRNKVTILCPLNKVRSGQLMIDKTSSENVYI